MMKRSLNKIIKKVNDNMQMKEFFSIENDKTYDKDVDTHEDHDQWEECNCFGDSVQFCVACNGMGSFNKDDADDSQSMKDDCIDDNNCSIHQSYRMQWQTS